MIKCKYFYYNQKFLIRKRFIAIPDLNHSFDMIQFSLNIDLGNYGKKKTLDLKVDFNIP
jgi:hypothetical protein